MLPAAAGWSLPSSDQVYLQGGCSPSWETEGTPQPTWYSDVMFMQTRISINYKHFDSSLSCRNCLWYLFIKTKVWMYSFMYLYPENLPAGYMPNPQGSTWHEKVYLIAGKSPSQMEMMKVQIFQGTARRVHLISEANKYHTTLGDIMNSHTHFAIWRPRDAVEHKKVHKREMYVICCSNMFWNHTW